MAPAGHTASSSTSALAKLLAWQQSGLLQQASYPVESQQLQQQQQ